MRARGLSEQSEASAAQGAGARECASGGMGGGSGGCGSASGARAGLVALHRTAATRPQPLPSPQAPPLSRRALFIVC